MRHMKVDVAIVGAGTAGLTARREVARSSGMPVVIEGGPYGTMCARVGCMPSKLLIAASEVAHMVDAAAMFGVNPAGGLTIDGRAVMARVRRERDRFVGSMVAATEELPAEQRLLGHARFIGPNSLQVGDHTRVDARAIVIATGSTPFVPAPFDAIRDHVMVSDDVFEMRDLPSSMAIIGAGLIALELGQAMHRLGVRVAFFSPFYELGPFSDPAIKETVHRDLSTELDIRLQVDVFSAEHTAHGVSLRWRDASGGSHEETFACVLVAAGRRPDVAGLDLPASGLVLGDAGLPHVDFETVQCGRSPIFFAGDVGGIRPLLHEAVDDGSIAGENAMLWPAVTRHRRRTPLAIGFTDPQMAMVGVRYDQLPVGKHAIGEMSFEDQPRARMIGRNKGLVRIYAEAPGGTLLGAEMFGPGIEHLAHLLAWAVQMAMTVATALTMPFYHPTLEEGLRGALRDLAEKLKG
jgi:dihydrolipoamide dehydrogenase